MYPNPEYHHYLAGAAAFLAGIVAVVSSLPLFAGMNTGGRPTLRWITIFFVATLTGRLLWLLYTWRLDDLFMRGLFGLESICACVLLVHSSWMTTKRP